MILSGVLTCTSIWFHCVGSVLALRVDKLYAHSLATMFWVESIWNFFQRRRRIDVIFVATINGVIYIYKCQSTAYDGFPSHLWHMLMHGVAVGGWSGYLLTQ